MQNITPQNERELLIIVIEKVNDLTNTTKEILEKFTKLDEVKIVEINKVLDDHREFINSLKTLDIKGKVAEFDNWKREWSGGWKLLTIISFTLGLILTGVALINMFK